MSIKIALLGQGRMSQELQQIIVESNELQLVGLWVRNNSDDDSATSFVRSTCLASLLTNTDVAIDFTLPAATDQVICAVTEAQIPLVCGVSGLTAANRQHLTDAAEVIPILYDRNMSLGVAVVQKLTQLAGSTLGDQFEAEIHETHHVHKIDAPSGTALQIGEILAASRGQDLDDVYHYDTDTTPDSGDIHFEVTRRDEVPGEHTVLFTSIHENLSITHEVSDRRVFAEGALKAARWLVTQAPGLYRMQDLVLSRR